MKETVDLMRAYEDLELQFRLHTFSTSHFAIDEILMHFSVTGCVAATLFCIVGNIL